jgi:two-component system OmpR family response regulator
MMLPGEDGLVLCRDLRARSKLPVIMLTAMREETDRIVGLEMGADDYLVKPFNPRELLARIKAVLRRVGYASDTAPSASSSTLRFTDWKIDLARRRLETSQGQAVDLTEGQFELLAAFVQHPRRVLSRDQLLDLTRSREAAPFDRSIDNQVSRLRRKIELDPSQPALIKTIRGGGYIFTANVEPDEETLAR